MELILVMTEISSVITMARISLSNNLCSSLQEKPEDRRNFIDLVFITPFLSNEEKRVSV